MPDESGMEVQVTQFKTFWRSVEPIVTNAIAFAILSFTTWAYLAH